MKRDCIPHITQPGNLSNKGLVQSLPTLEKVAEWTDLGDLFGGVFDTTSRKRSCQEPAALMTCFVAFKDWYIKQKDTDSHIPLEETLNTPDGPTCFGWANCVYIISNQKSITDNQHIRLIFNIMCWCFSAIPFHLLFYDGIFGHETELSHFVLFSKERKGIIHKYSVFFSIDSEEDTAGEHQFLELWDLQRHKKKVSSVLFKDQLIKRWSTPPQMR